MPPRIRTRASKAMKENLNINSKLKTLTNSTKANRRVLADKTNSASDETSNESSEKSKRRLPTRCLTTSNKKKSNNRENDITAAIIETPPKLETSLVMNRPRRICRLPSRFDDHLLSPNKVMPVQPTNASTPIPQSKTKHTSKDKATRIREKDETQIVKPPNSMKIIDKQQKKIYKNDSFQVLGGTKTSQNHDTREKDIYEFTFDPTEEPKPPNKKRKKPAVRKQRAVEPKSAPTYKRVYDQNISKALSALKKAIKPTKSVEKVKMPQIRENCSEVEEHNIQNYKNQTPGKETTSVPVNDTCKTPMYDGNYPSIRIEDIAADIEPSVDHHDDLNYSPVNSPKPVGGNTLDPQPNSERIVNDPLNLQADLSFFDDVPVASSSMNKSVRHPLASPWRVEFGSLPIKWHSNAYVKPNMTPAVESSFICTEDSTKKKHVYTNMLIDTNESSPQIVSDTPALKQTSILSFIREVAEKKAKKKRGRPVSPSKPMPIEFSKTAVERNMSTNEEQTNKVDNPVSSEEVCEPIDTSNETENSKEKRNTTKRKNDENVCVRPTKSPCKRKDKDCTYFGFDDSEDQENVSPSKLKVNSKGRNLRPKARAVLQEINGPTRLALPVAAKSKILTSSDAVNKVYEGLKSAADAPVFSDNNVENNFTNIDDLDADDSQSVHLFEDIEVVHHLKPTRKSYGKAKKVTFCQRSDSTSPEGQPCEDDHSSFEDDLADLTFEVPDVQEKKKTKKKRSKKLMSKKEAKEAEEWAAGFNSMCEEIEEFPLMVE